MLLWPDCRHDYRHVGQVSLMSSPFSGGGGSEEEFLKGGWWRLCGERGRNFARTRGPTLQLYHIFDQLRASLGGGGRERPGVEE